MRSRIIISLLLTSIASNHALADSYSLSKEAIAKELGWMPSDENRCGGYYFEPAFVYSENLLKNNLIKITSDQLLFAQHGTSVWQGRVTITRYGQQIIANKAYLYRDPETGETNAIELVDHITMREPNSLVIAQHGRYNLKTKSQSLHDILYRTAIYSDKSKKPLPSNEELQKSRKVTQLSAWGEAKDFNQDKPQIYEFEKTSYSTCPPTSMAWQVKASHLTLNKETGRGDALNARIYARGIPVFYAPYFNFPIDSRRKTGFLWPSMGATGKYGPYFNAPFYWNIAPNYDMTFTPAYLSKRGLQLSDTFRYLSESTSGKLNVELLPNDAEFRYFQIAQEGEFGSSPDPAIQSELRHLEQASTSRKAFNWQNTTRFDEHWSSDIDYNFVSDDYYLRDFSNNNVNEVTQNQLLRQGQLTYQGQNWNFIGRLQAYQTLHPVDGVETQNAYSRFPQLVLNGNYPDNPGGLEYFIDNDVSRFDIQNNPGSVTKFPMGTRFNTQPGVSRSFNLPYLSVTPRLQYALTQYAIGDVMNDNSKSPSRALPIFDLSTQLYFDRHVSLFNKGFRQTLEPQIYYVYIPYRDQNQLPVFDTTVNILTFDQLFLYNRFSGLDRINDANQVSLGLATRLLDDQSGSEKMKLAVGQILYFRDRKVTLCTNSADPLCPNNSTDTPDSSDNYINRSPLAGVLTYNINEKWSASANTIYNTKANEVNNQSINVQYKPTDLHIINLGYNFVRNGDITMGTALDNLPVNNLSQTDLSFTWLITREWSAIGRWTETWNRHRFQNLLFGLQYDSCCWAIRTGAGRIFTNLSPNNTYVYNPLFYLQIALKGLGPIGSSDPSQMLSSNIAGYKTNFGRDF